MAIDENAEKTLQKLSKELGVSYSFLVRQAIKLLGELPDPTLVRQWCSLLQKGEQVILDLDRLCLLLRHVNRLESSFYKENRRVSKSHAQQLRNMEPLEYLKRLEACNLFRLVVNGDNQFTLIQPSPLLRKFVKTHRRGDSSFHGLPSQVGGGYHQAEGTSERTSRKTSVPTVTRVYIHRFG